MQKIQLASGHEMPVLGLGTWDLRDAQCKEVVKRAIGMGYTHLDTAWMYENQRAIGEAVRESGVGRSELFITSKIWKTHLEYDAVLGQCEEILEQLQTGYVDLLLVHWPSDAVPLPDTLNAFENIYEEGKARSIGVSNFSADLVDQARQICRTPISVNQVMYHTHQNQEELRRHCAERGVVMTAYCPLAKGEFLDDPVLREVAAYHGKTSAQVTLKWLVQKGVIAIPKASSEAHLRANIELFDWELRAEEMQRIDALCKNPSDSYS